MGSFKLGRAEAAWLHSVHCREIAEKLNVWVGWMNLENRFGSQETLAKVFESALQQNEPLDVYKKLASIYVQSEKYDFANKLYQTMTKKFANVLSVWSQYTTFLMKQGRQAQARVLLQKGLKGLASKRDRKGGREGGAQGSGVQTGP